MNTKALRQKILDLAIHGKLVPQDPNDEPASVLLERIRAKKERLIKEGKIKRPKKTKATSDKPHYPYELPEGWVWTTLEEICSKIGSGSTPKGSNYSKEGVPFFRSQNVHNFGLVLSDIKYISDKVHQSMKGTEVIANDLLLNITGGSLGRCAVVPNDFEIGNVSQHVCILRTVLVNPEYLHCFILSSFFAKSMKITGSGREGLPKYNLEKMLLSLPPIQEQERIIIEAKRLHNYLDKIDTCNGNLAELISQAKSKILDLAIHGKLVPQDPTDEPAAELLKRINPKAEITSDNGHYQKLPEGWAILKVGNVAEYINGRAFKPEEWEQTGLPIIRIQNLNDPNAYYNYTRNEYEEKYLIKKGDLLFAWAASLGTYIWKGEDAWLNQHIFKVVPYPFMDKKYLYYAFHAMIAEFYRKSHGSGMIHITRKQFEEITLWLPPLTEQHRIVHYLQQVFKKLDSIVENL